MALPIMQSTGAISGAGTQGQGRDDLVAGERVDLQDVVVANVGKSYFYEFEDIPIGSGSTIINPATATPHFFVDADPLLAGSYRVKCTVGGLESVTEVYAIALSVTGGRRQEPERRRSRVTEHHDWPPTPVEPGEGRASPWLEPCRPSTSG